MPWYGHWVNLFSVLTQAVSDAFFQKWFETAVIASTVRKLIMAIKI